MPSVTWDSGFEASPADTDEAKYGASKIRQLKLAISERGELEFDWKAGTQPFVKAGKAAVCYSGTTAEINALTGMAAGACAWDTTLSALKRYSGAEWTKLLDIAIPSGTKMLFYQDTAPTGWTIQSTLNDKLVYVTKGSAAGGQTGGTIHSTGSWTISGFAANVGDTTLTINQIPSHYHQEAMGLFSGATYPYRAWGQAIYTGTLNTEATGGGQAHSHTMASHNGTWRPAAYCCIICSKN